MSHTIAFKIFPTAAAFGLVLTAAVGTEAAAAAPTCGGKAATILAEGPNSIGYWDEPVVAGTDEADVIVYSGTESTKIYGLGGDDVICAPAVEAQYGVLISGGEGDDTIYGSSKQDNLAGDGGNDIIYGGDGNDSLTGSDGSDRIYGDPGNDFIREDGFEFDGDDYIKAGPGNDLVSAGDGHDTIKGGSGNDLLQGNAGNDIVKGNSGDDKLKGGLGDDYLFGGSGNDRLRGQSGDDYLDGGSGKDRLRGGPGKDRIR